MANTTNLGIPKPDESYDVDQEFFRLMEAWDMVDAIIYALQQTVAGKAAADHTHTIDQIQNLTQALADKMNANKTFSLDDLTDVDGAAAAAINYVLVKNAQGMWVPSSAIAALGVHEHSIAQVQQLQQTLDALAALDLATPRSLTPAQKGQAIANIGGGALAGLRNKFINPLFAINNRAVAGTVTLAPFAYGHDRLKAGGAGCTYTFSAANGVTTINITSGSLLQIIEASALSGEAGDYVLGWVGTAQGRIDGGPWGNSGAVSKVCDGSANILVEFGLGTVSLVQFEKEYLGAFSARHRSMEENLCLRYFRPFADVRYKTNTLITGNVVYYGTMHHYGMRAAPSYIFGPNPSVFTSAVGIDNTVTANLSLGGAGDRHSSRISGTYTGTGQTSGFFVNVALEAEL